MRLIDADELLLRYDETHEGPPRKARKLIEEAPTIKEQEPARAIREFSDDDGSWWYECGNCLNPVDCHDVFCKYCGKRLKWDD